ncbi:MAG: hypothetical protein ACKVU4_03380, partial [Phycisphaerales bacterium]
MHTRVENSTAVGSAAPPSAPRPTPAPPATSRPRSGAKRPAAKSGGKVAKPAQTGTRKPAAKRGRMSGLDAAAKVLADSGQPMRCAEIVERVFAR